MLVTLSNVNCNHASHLIVVPDFFPCVTFRRLRPDGVLAAVDGHVFRLHSTFDPTLVSKTDKITDPILVSKTDKITNPTLVRITDKITYPTLE